MENLIYKKSYNIENINRKEILRYAGVKNLTTEFDEVINQCIAEAEPILSCNVCYKEFDVEATEEGVKIGDTIFKSKDLFKNLKNCKRVILFAATVGIGLDRLIAKYSRSMPSRALFLQSLGAERIEELCDEFERDINNSLSKDNQCTAPRFSAGYGDLNINAQKEIFRLLQPSRHIGVSLNESLFMSPSKSVTAILGIMDKKFSCDKKIKCEICEKTDCIFRR